MGSVSYTRDGKCIFGIRTMVDIANSIRLREGGARTVKAISFFTTHSYWLRINIHRYALFYSPPFVYAHVRASSEPRIDDEYATKCDGTFESLTERWIIVQSQSFAEPMHQVSFAFHTWCGYHVASRLMGNACRMRALTHHFWNLCHFFVQIFRCCIEFQRSFLFGFFLTS